MKELAVQQDRPAFRSLLLDAAMAAFGTALLLAAALRAWRYDLSVPFNYWGDTLVFSALAHGLLLNGWPHHIPQLSAPFGFDAVAFPALTSSDWVLMHAIGVFFDSPGVVLNLFWLLAIVLTACSCALALRLVNVCRPLAIAAAVLFALLPYAFSRNTAHIVLVYYTVPLLCVLCMYLLRKNWSAPNASLIFKWGIFAAVVQGFNYVYYSFFATVLIAVSGLIGFLVHRSPAIIKQTLAVCAVLMAASALNLAPAVYNWHVEGKPADMDYKRPAEAEVYALKLRQMLRPHEDNAVTALRDWANKDRAAQFPNENENSAARLGIFGSAGLLLGLGLLIRAALTRTEVRNDYAMTAAVLLLITFLITTVGGLGAVFNLLVTADIRAYNRFSVFLAFFAFAVLALVLSDGLSRHVVRRRRLTLVSISIVLLGFSAYDQLLDARQLRVRYATDAEMARLERSAVKALEAKVPAHTSVFQLPVTGFPLDSGSLKMGPYDHARPFLWSTNLKWSWPSFSNRHRALMEKLLATSDNEFGEALVLAGYDAVWLDRYGYSDEGGKIVDALLHSGARKIEAGERFSLFDLRPVEDKLKERLGEQEFMSAAEASLPGMTVEYGNGFYPPETNPEGLQFRWMQRNATITLRNHTSLPFWIRIEAALLAQSSATIELAVGDGRIDSVQADANGRPFEVAAQVPARGSLKLRWNSTHSATEAKGDPRFLYTMMINPRLSFGPLPHDLKPAQ